MKPNTYFIPININKLAHFFARGVIVPSSYLSNAQKDIQNLFDEYILLSTEKFTTDTNCCIEVALSKGENPQPITDNFLLLNVPLAISRVVAVFFKSSEELTNAKYNITRGDAFLPDFLLEVASDKSIDTSELKEYEASENTRNWHNELKMYDQLMGGFSLMKISAEEGKHPEHYLKTLGNINNWFDNESKENLDTNIFSMLFSESSNPLRNKFKKLIYSRVTISEVESFAEEERVPINKAIAGGIDLHSIAKDSLTYILAILAVYNEDNGGSLNTSDFFYDFSSKKLNADRSEAISLAFGLNKGYSALPKIFSLEKINLNIKFKLDDKSDLYIIESIYQNVFNNNTDFNPCKLIDTYWNLPIEYGDTNIKEVNESSYSNTKISDIEDSFDKELFDPLKNITNIISKKFFAIENLISNIYSKFASLTSDFDKKLQQEKVQSERQVHELNKSISNLTAGFDSKLEQESAKHSQEKLQSERQISGLTELVTSLKVDFDSKLEQESAKHSQEKLQSESKISELNELVTSLKVDFNSKLEQESAKHSQEKIQAESKISELNERIASLEADFDSKLKQESDKHIQERIQSEHKVNELIKHIAKLTEGFDSKLEQESAKHSQEKLQSERRISELNERIASLAADFDSKLKQESDKHIQERTQSEHKVNELIEHIAKLTEGFDSKLEQESAKQSQEKLQSESQISELNERVVLEVDKYQNTTDDQSKQKSNFENNMPLLDTPSDLFEEELSIASKASREKELKSKKRGELNHLAEDIGLEFNQYNNKTLLIKAILSKELIKDNVN